LQPDLFIIRYARIDAGFVRLANSDHERCPD
jgi:hypothetical protein